MRAICEDRFAQWARLSLINPAALQTLHNLAFACYMIKGDAIEVGVYRGGSLGLIADTLPHKTVWGCDTFAGIPFRGARDTNAKGSFACSEETVRRNVPLPNVNLWKGQFPQEAPPINRLAFAHLDCDQEQSYREALPWIVARMQKGGVIVCDDYCHESCEGAKAAIDGWMPDGLTLISTKLQAWIRWNC